MMQEMQSKVGAVVESRRGEWRGAIESARALR
jgi:hypothetical protein